MPGRTVLSPSRDGPMCSSTRLQGGYKTFHTERTGKGEPEGSRHLVFMTYLNDVTDRGVFTES